MPDVLVRGLSRETIKRYEAQAGAQGISRNELMVRCLEADAPTNPAQAGEWDWDAVTVALTDLADPDVMAAAWQ